MNFRNIIALVIALNSALAGVAAHASYVVEANGFGVTGSAIANGADFDFVTHDFGIEAKDAIQIALTNLRNIPNLRGNLLLWSPASGVDLSTASTATARIVTTDSLEDFSYYDDGGAGDATGSNVVSDRAVSSAGSLPASVQDLPMMDSNAIFWILGPAELTSFSQMTAARFGF